MLDLFLAIPQQQRLPDTGINDLMQVTVRCSYTIQVIWAGDIGDEVNRNIDFQGSSIAGKILFDVAEKMTRYSEHNVSMNVNVPGKNGEGNRSVPMTQNVVLQLMQIVKKKAK